jgi:DNA-binding transcriptional LysR family regulator
MDRIRALRAFVRAVEVGTFTAVADELRVKQSTISKWMAGLEAELGVPLLHRTTRASRLTEAGETFLARAREVLAAYDRALAEVQARAPELRGRLRASVPVVFGARYVVPAASAFLRAHPGVELELVYSDRYQRLVDEGLDLAVRVGIPADTSARAIALGRSRRHLVASPAYLEGAPPLRGPADLSAHRCLLHTGLDAAVTWSFRDPDGHAVRASVRGRFSANHSASLLAMARAGHGVALLADWLLQDDLASGRLVSLLEGFEPPPAPIQGLVPAGRAVHPRVRAFLDLLRDHLRRALPA